MTTIKPQIAAGLQLTAGDVVGSHQHYIVSSTEGTGNATLPAPLVALLLLFDGQRSYADIKREADELGMQLPREDFVEVFAHKLSEASLVELVGREIHAPTGIRYSCLMCGTSCCGPEVGPLPPHESEKVERQWQDYVERGLLPADKKPLRYDEKGQGYLTRHERGRCTFLQDNNACLIHAEEGLAEKPLACQLFPIVAVEIDGEMRLGFSQACSRSHRTFEDGPLFDLKKEYESLDRTVAPYPRDYVAPDKPPEQLAADEAQVRRILEDHEPGLLELAALAADGGSASERTVTDPMPLLKPVIARWARAVHADLEAGHWPEMHVTRESDRARRLIAMAEVVLEEDVPDGVLELPDRWRRYLANRLRNQIWLRTGFRHGSLRESLLITLLGVAVCAWYALSEHPDDDEAAYDAFSEGLVIWHLAQARRANAERLIGRTERRRILTAIRGK